MLKNTGMAGKAENIYLFRLFHYVMYYTVLPLTSLPVYIILCRSCFSCIIIILLDILGDYEI